MIALILTACVERAAVPEPEPSLSPLPQVQSPAPLEGGTLNYAIQEPTAIVPPAAMAPSDFVVVDALFDSLTAYRRDLSTKPAAAAKSEPNDDATVWTFTLRGGATFHDGTPVTAASFKFAWEEAIRLDRIGYLLWMVEGYEKVRDGTATELAGARALDDLTLEVRLTTPYAQFDAVVAHPALGPVPPEAWDTESYERQPIGNGPFRATEPWAADKFIRVARFEDWRNDDQPAVLQEVLFRILDVETAYLAFHQDLVQFTTLPAGALAPAKDLYGESVDGYSGPGVLTGDIPVLYYLGFNVAQPPFDDPEVRRAVSKAIDREAIAATNLDGNLRVARSAVPRGVPSRSPPACGACAHLPEEAERVFAEHEITELELWFNGDGGHEAIAASIKADLEDVGVRLRLREASFDSYLASLQAGELGLFRFGWTLDHLLADNVLYPLFHSRTDSAELSGNLGDYANEQVDSLLEQARATRLPDQRQQLQRDAERIAVGEEMAIAPLVTLRHSAVVSERVEDFYYSPLGLPNLADVRLRPPKPSGGA